SFGQRCDRTQKPRLINFGLAVSLTRVLPYGLLGLSAEASSGFGNDERLFGQTRRASLEHNYRANQARAHQHERRGPEFPAVRAAYGRLFRFTRLSRARSTDRPRRFGTKGSRVGLVVIRVCWRLFSSIIERSSRFRGRPNGLWSAFPEPSSNG